VIAYQVPGWPAGQQGHSAVTPHFNRLAASGAMAYKDRVTGEPGTLAIPVDGPGVPQNTVGQAQMGRARTSDAPRSFRPNLYYARPERSFWPGAGVPVAVAADNLMPVPATDPRGVPARLSMPIVQRGSAQVISRPVLSTWPNWTSR
jgi:hypothetical protein